MRKQRVVIRKLRRGQVLYVAREHYLRNDIGCGLLSCSKCPSRAPSASHAHREQHHHHQQQTESGKQQQQQQQHTEREPEAGAPVLLPSTAVLILDLPLFLHQLDVFRREDVLCNAVLLQSVLADVREHSRYVHREVAETIGSGRTRRHLYTFSNEHHAETYVERMRGESLQQRSQRAVLAAARWYTEHLKGWGPKVLLLSTSQAAVEQAKQAGVEAMTVAQWIQRQKPALLNVLASSIEEEDERAQKEGAHQLWEAHWSEEEVKEGINDGTLLECRFYRDRDDPQRAVGVVRKGEAREVQLVGKHSNRAITGDWVAVKLLPKKKQSQEEEEEDSGKVVGIVKRDMDKAVTGSIVEESLAQAEKQEGKKRDSVLVQFETTDPILPTIELRLHNPQQYRGRRLVVKIDGWSRFRPYPSGHFVRDLGRVGDPKVEGEALLIQFGIRYDDWSESIKRYLRERGITKDFVIPEEEARRRTDFRHLNVVSIDPPGCTDIDDALHAVALPNGNIQVGVHIADVGYYVEEGCDLDMEARKRCTTVYLVDRRIDMLPEVLGSNLCSLMSNVDRLAVSCVWELNEEAQIVATSFHKSIIRSRASFTYGQAQQRLDTGDKSDPINRSLRLLYELSRKLRAKRQEMGALSLSSPTVRFIREKNEEAADSGVDAIDVELYQMKDTNSLVEEFMLLANISVANHIWSTYPSFSMLRRHPPPEASRWKRLKEQLASIGVVVQGDDSKAINDCLVGASDMARVLVTRYMQQAVYFSSGSQSVSEFRHFGLAAPIYTHFTSPIRRYADVVVHRLLAASIAWNPLPQMNNKEVMRIAHTINHRHRMAQIAGRASAELYSKLYLEQSGQKEEDGWLLSLVPDAKQVRVIVPTLGVEGMMDVSAQELEKLQLLQKVRVAVKGSVKDGFKFRYVGANAKAPPAKKSKKKK